MADEQTKAKPAKAAAKAAEGTTTTYEEAQEKGYMGWVPDPTPNENYGLQTPQDAPTPETDQAAHEAAQKALADQRAAASA